MAIGPFQGYSVFDSLMRESISRQRAIERARAARAAQPAQSGVTQSRAEQIATGTAVTQTPATPSFANQAGGMQALPSGGAAPVGSSYSSFATGSYGMVDGEVVDVTASPELKSAEGFKSISGGKAAVESPIASTGLSQYGKMGKVGLGVIGFLDKTPFNAFTSFMGGSTVVDPYGKKTTVPLGILGKVAEMNIKQQYDVFDKIQAKTPGYHQFYSGGQLVSIVPQTLLGFDVGYAVLGTTNLTSEQAIAQYATMFGYDPATVDLSKSPGDPGFGQDLTGFVPGVGGVNIEGSFIDTTGNISSQPRDTRGYLGNLADIYGVDYAVNAATAMGVREDIIDDLYVGNITSKAYYNKDGSLAGYGTGTGGIVTSGDGTPVKSGSGYVTYGTGYISPEQMDTLQSQGQAASTYGTKVGSQQTQMLAEQDSFLEDDDDGGYTPGSQMETNPTEAAKEASMSGWGNDDGPDDNDTSDSSTSTSEGRSDAGYDTDTSGGYGGWGWAKGGFVSRRPMQEGGEADVPVAQDAGVVGQSPETLPEGTTVADDVELDVPEGTFILNAPAVEFMGSADVKKMILTAMAEAEKQGIDIKQENSKIPKEDLVSLVVSRGEVVIPPQLAKIIGYDRLNKINNRGKAEVQKRIEENGQAEQPEQGPEEPPVVQAAEGVDTRGMIDLGDVVNYRDFKNPQSSFMNMLEVTGAGATGNLEAMEKAFSYSRKWNQLTKSGDDYEDTFRHTLVGGLYGDVGGFYADAKENWHKYIEAYPKIGYEKVKGMLGGQTDEEQIGIARSIIAESDVDLNNNAFGRELRKQIPDEEEYVRTVERMMNIAVTEGIDKVPSITTEDGEQLRLQLSTVPAE